MEEQIEIKKIENAFVVAVKVDDNWIAKVGDSKMIAEAFDVSQVEDRGLQARLCKDSIYEATDCKAMTLAEFRAFRSQVEESNEKLFTT